MFSKAKFKVTLLKQRAIYMTSGHCHGLKLSGNVRRGLDVDFLQKK